MNVVFIDMIWSRTSASSPSNTCSSSAPPQSLSVPASSTGRGLVPVLLNGTAELCGGALDARVFEGLDELVRDQIMSMKTTFTPGHYRRRVAGVLARRLVASLFGQ